MEPRWTVRSVREEVWKGRVSFPSQVPVFQHLQRAEIQWRIALLYFVRRWDAAKIADRYGVSRTRVLQMLRQWTSRAITLGFVDSIPPETRRLSETSYE